MGEILFTERRQFVADHFHSLPESPEPRHGHNWEIEATVRNDQTPALGIALDDWIQKIDYTSLNDDHAFARKNPTTEAVAELVFRYLEAHGFDAVAVLVREKPNYYAVCLRS